MPRQFFTNAFKKESIKAEVDGEVELGEILNLCIKNALKGKVLDLTSVEMKSIVMYIKSLAQSAQHL